MKTISSVFWTFGLALASTYTGLPSASTTPWEYVFVMIPQDYPSKPTLRQFLPDPVGDDNLFVYKEGDENVAEISTIKIGYIIKTSLVNLFNHFG